MLSDTDKRTLSEEQKKKLSGVAKGRSRTATGQFAPITTAQEAQVETPPTVIIKGMESHIKGMELRISELEVSNEYNAAEFTRATESLRLCEQGRDAAILSRNEYRSALTAAIKKLRDAEGALSKAQASEKKAHELLSSLTAEVEAQGSARRLAEGRYVALHRRRSIEWGILITSVVGGIVIAGLFALVNGGAK
jgi:hypothetical protein